MSDFIRLGRIRVGRAPWARAFMLTFSCAALFVLASGCASVAPKADPMHAAYMATAAADVITTQQALNQGAVEVNPLLGSHPSTGKLVALKAAGWVAVSSLEGYLEKRMKRPLRWWERVIVWGAPIGLQTWAAYQNSSAGR